MFEKIYLAPMEGVTGYVFRNTYAKYFGDIDRYFTPFIGNKTLNTREQRDVSPDNNKELELIPQILTNKAEVFLEVSDKLKELGYEEVNLNLGCPSKTVVSRGRGSGFLAFPDELDSFLYEIFDRAHVRISIKTRVGMESLEEWDRLLDMYKKYPLSELIVHPRLQKDYYNGHPDLLSFAKAKSCTYPVCYNGDITCNEELEKIFEACPGSYNIMLGRGIIKKPWLVSEIRKKGMPDRRVLRDFHQELAEGYMKEMNAERDALFKLKEFWSYFGQSFSDDKKLLKMINKSRSLAEYMAAANEIIRSCEME